MKVRAIGGSILAVFGLVSPALAQGQVTSAGLLHPKLSPGYHVPASLDWHHDPMFAAAQRSLATGTMVSLPSWSHGFSVAGQNYNYTLIGTDPSLGAATTTIPTVIVPIRLTIEDDVVNGKPLVLNATPTMASVVGSPIFQATAYDSGTLQFTDAMLHAEFPQASPDWHLILAPTVAPTLDVIMPTGTTQIIQTKSGKMLAILNNGAALNSAMNTYLHANFSPNNYVIFVTYNALLSGAFGFHSAILAKHGTEAEVFTYTSWLEDVNDAFTIPSPNADTLAHEAAEVVHDALGLSLTLEWGDWFNRNKCFQPYIEVGDAVEDAPTTVQNWHQKAVVGGKTVTYTLQSEALLPFFTREFPSSAINQAYSFPNETAILGPAPLSCRK